MAFKIFILNIALLIIMSFNVFAQSDSLTTHEDTVEFSQFDNDRIYKLFIEGRDTEVNHLWKINLVDINYINPKIGYEQKLLKNITSDTYLDLLYRAPSSGYKSQQLGGNIEQQFKYYYNFNRRQSKGKRIARFSGNYFSISGYGTYYSYQEVNNTSFSNNAFMDFYSTAPSERYHLYNVKVAGSVKYGLQRSIGNIGYIDAYIGLLLSTTIHSSSHTSCPLEVYDVYSQVEPVYQHIGSNYENPVHFIFNVRMGFSIDSMNNLKRMLK